MCVLLQFNTRICDGLHAHVSLASPHKCGSYACRLPRGATLGTHIDYRQGDVAAVQHAMLALMLTPAVWPYLLSNIETQI